MESETETEGQHCQQQQSTSRTPPPPLERSDSISPFEWATFHNNNALLTRMLMKTTWQHDGEVITEDDFPLAVSWYTTSGKDAMVERNTFILDEFLSHSFLAFPTPFVISKDAFLTAIQLPKGNPPPDVKLDHVEKLLEGFDLKSVRNQDGSQKNPFENHPYEDVILAAAIRSALEADMRNGDAKRLLLCLNTLFKSSLNSNASDSIPRVFSYTLGHRDGLFSWVQMFAARDKALFDAPYTCSPLNPFVRPSSSTSSMTPPQEMLSTEITTFIPDMVWIGDTPGIVALVVEAKEVGTCGKKAEAQAIRQMINMMHYQKKVCGLLITGASAVMYLVSKEVTRETCNTKCQHYLKMQQVVFHYRSGKSLKMEVFLDFVRFLMKVLWIWNQDPLKVATT